MIVDCALYEAGTRLEYDPEYDTLTRLREHPDAFAWIGFAMPTTEELTQACEALGISELVDVDEVLAPHRQPVLSVEVRSSTWCCERLVTSIATRRSRSASSPC